LVGFAARSAGSLLCFPPIFLKKTSWARFHEQSIARMDLQFRSREVSSWPANGLRTIVVLDAWNFLVTYVARPMCAIFLAVHLAGSSWP